jgi:23S rRNA (pseudouridine1915-N3)-methyltransferase
MNVTLLMIGKTSEKYVADGYRNFMKRLSHYLNITEVIIPDLKDRKNLIPEQVKEKEATLLLARIPPAAFMVLLDEKAKEFTSLEFASFIQKSMNSGVKEVVFVIGGAYGVAASVKARADSLIALSRMTFTHQFIRLIITEQLYRACTILKNEPYHNE